MQDVIEAPLKRDSLPLPRRASRTLYAFAATWLALAALPVGPLRPRLAAYLWLAVLATPIFGRDVARRVSGV